MHHQSLVNWIPLPICLVKEFTMELAPTLTKLVNRSISTGEFSGNLKKVLLRPLLKKFGLSVIFKNFKPVSNLCYSTKLIQCVVSHQLIEFTKESGMVEPPQSACRSQHSTETALLDQGRYPSCNRQSEGNLPYNIRPECGIWYCFAQSIT